MDTAKSIREDYLHQNAFHEVDTYASLNKQYRMLKLIILANDLGKKALEDGIDINDILSLSVKEKIGRSKYIEEKNLAEFDKIEEEFKAQISSLNI